MAMVATEHLEDLILQQLREKALMVSQTAEREATEKQMIEARNCQGPGVARVRLVNMEMMRAG